MSDTGTTPTPGDEAIRFAEEYGYNRWQEARDELASLRTRLAEAEARAEAAELRLDAISLLLQVDDEHTGWDRIRELQARADRAEAQRALCVEGRQLDYEEIARLRARVAQSEAHGRAMEKIEQSLNRDVDALRTRLAEAEAALREIAALEVMEQRPGTGVSGVAIAVLETARSIAPPCPGTRRRVMPSYWFENTNHYNTSPCWEQPGKQQWHLACALKHPVRLLRSRGPKQWRYMKKP